MSNSYPVKAPKKLIEVALPLDDINIASAREKSIRHGHPSTLHLWWARRPLAAARAVIFAQLVNDPSWKWELEHAGEVPPNNLKASWAAKRKQLFALISEFVKWENTTNEELLKKARAEIRKSWKETCEVNKDHPNASELFNPEKLPGLHDPFAGGGAIPLEAQRLGLDAVASDLNPVAVLINKAMIEIPPRFAGKPPVHPDAQHEAKLNTWTGAQGLAEDVRRYGTWMRDEAEKRIGHLYPKVTVTAEMAKERPDLKGYVGKELKVIAWLWARTVKSPNPAFSHVDVPLVSTFVLAQKKGKEHWVETEVEGDQYRFKVRRGRLPAGAKDGTKASGRGANFRCLVSGANIEADWIRAEAQAGRMGERLMAIVGEGVRERVYLSPDGTSEIIAHNAEPDWKPDVEFFQQALGFRIGNYGMTRWSDLFTARQLVALSTFSALVAEARERVPVDAVAAGLGGSGRLRDGGAGPQAYGDAVGVYLSFMVSRAADFLSSLCIWANQPKNELVTHLFGKQTISMAWDFGEVNPLSDSGGNFANHVDYVAKGILSLPANGLGVVQQMDATTSTLSIDRFVSTDPPYFDNIGYADLSDYFYVWLRRANREVFPSLFATMSVPKSEELVATPGRHGGREAAEHFFQRGMFKALSQAGSTSHPAGVLTIFYAFKQSDEEGSARGWSTFLEGIVRSGLAITGAWPMRTERTGRLRDNASNALASSIVLVCRRRLDAAQTISRRRFIRELNAVLPEALDEMTMGAGADQSPVAPVDLSQAIIGPGMAVFSKYAAVLEADGTPMTVNTALQLINRFFAEDDFDADTQFCLRWFEQHGWTEGQYGEADVLARAKATSVGGVVDAGVLFSGGGKVRLLRWADYPADWDPAKDKRLPIWEALHQLIRAFKKDGESGSGRILGVIKDKTEAIRQLAYRLYTLCERRGWAEDARAYNELVTSWSAIETVANTVPDPHATEQLGLDFGGEK